MENILEARMAQQRPKDGGHGPQKPGVFSAIFGILVDALGITLAGIIIFAAYYTVAYPETSELDAALSDANTSLVLAEPSPDSVVASRALESRKGPPLEPASYPIVTRAWVMVMEKYLRTRKYFEKQVKDYRDPTYHKLLPDMAPELRGRVKTLVLDLEDLLVHKEWTRQSGWKIYKRPGVQDFLVEMASYYELVIFTDQPASYADPVLNKLDPQRAVMYRLYRPETQYHNGKHVRDLSKLNRDLSQVLFISAEPDAWEFQPENTLKLKPWHSSPGDTTLLDLVPMLHMIATRGPRDVRDVVKAYAGEDDPGKTFKARQAQLSASKQTQPKPRGLFGMSTK